MAPSQRKRSGTARPRRAAGRHAAAPAARRRAHWLRRALLLLLVVPGLLVAGAAALLLTYSFASVPLPGDLDVAPTVVYDVRGEEIGQLQQQATRQDIALADLPGHVVDAVLAAEDAGFHEHRGVSIPGIVRAAYTNVRHGEIRQGGSTISQQYVKNLTGETDDTLLRKVNEAVLAVKLERRLPKDRILEMYLNSIYFGRGAYGIQAAARAYFGVDAHQLGPEQAVLLAGILPAPSAWDPERDPETARRRYDYVLGRLGDEGLASPDDIERLREDYPVTLPSRVVVSRRAPFFLAMVEQELSRLLGAQFVHRGLAVRTSLDLRMQEIAERVYAEAFAEVQVADHDTWPTGALVALDPATGGVRALVGGPDYAVDQYNLAVGGPRASGRQLGSTFKLFGLAAWIEQGYSPDSLVDAPARVSFTAGELGIDTDWEPRNFGGADLGRVTLREATWQSSNTAYARLAVDLGPALVLDAARRAGIDPRGRLRPDPALVLGTGEVTPLRLAESYNTFAAGGTYRRTTSILEVSRNGQPLVTTNIDGRPAFDEHVAAHVSDVLSGVLSVGTGKAAALDRPAAGKTGTTSNHADAWFAGYTPDLTAVVWMGHRDDNEPMAGEPTGGGFPARLWAAFMSEALDGIEPTPFPEPSGDLAVVTLPLPCPEGQELVPIDADDPDSEPVCAEPVPTEAPTGQPAEDPTEDVTEDPTEDATEDPTGDPTDDPTGDPAEDLDFRETEQPESDPP